MKTPALFVSHGATTFALEPGQAGPLLQAVGKRVLMLSGVRAIIVVSPHWRTRGQRAARDGARLRRVSPLAEQGLDHGVWVPLLHILPGAPLPVLQLSLPIEMRATDELALGRALAPLREQGILMMGSGSLTHNLYEFRQPETEAPEDYVREFVLWARRAAIAHDDAALVNFRGAPHSRRAHCHRVSVLVQRFIGGIICSTSCARTSAVYRFCSIFSFFPPSNFLFFCEATSILTWRK